MRDVDPAQLRREFWAGADDALFDRATAAAPFYLSVASLEAFAIKGGGPPYVRIGRRALYRKRDVLAWAEKHGRRIENTSQIGVPT